MIGKQLKELLRMEKIEVKDFSQMMGIAQTTIYNWCGDVDPSVKTMYEIKNKYHEKTGKNINLDWLISGEGKPFISEEKAENSLTPEEIKKIKAFLTEK